MWAVVGVGRDSPYACEVTDVFVFNTEEEAMTLLRYFCKLDLEDLLEWELKMQNDVETPYIKELRVQLADVPTLSKNDCYDQLDGEIQLVETKVSLWTQEVMKEEFLRLKTEKANC